MLAGCVSNEAAVLNSGRTDVERIQASLRESVLSAFDVVEEDELVIAEAEKSTAPLQNPALESAETKAWRASVTDRWKGLAEGKGNEVCEIFFAGLVDPGSTLGEAFRTSRERFISEGTNIHSLTDIRMVSDNRKTIQIPTAQSSSSLFICEAQAVLRMPTQNLSTPKALRFSWNYYLDNTEIKWSFSFQFTK